MEKIQTDKQRESKSPLYGYRKPAIDEDGDKWCMCTIPVLIRPIDKGLATCMRCWCGWYK